MGEKKHKTLKLAFSSIRMQVITMFLLLTVLLVGIITQIYTAYYHKMMENEVIRQTMNTGEQISMQAEMLIDEANKILQWGNSTDAYNFLNAKGERYKETLQLINDISMYRKSMLIDKTVRNIYLFDIDGTTYNEKIGIYQREKYEKSEYIYKQITQQQDCLIFVPHDEIEEEDLVSVKASAPGFLRRFVTINEEVNRGQLLGEVINPYNGEILSEIRSTADGIIFYAEDQPTILENASAFQVIKKLHE